ncbi:MAG: nuclear transport factor 2 family protein [Acidimicrobiales bacterium]
MDVADLAELRAIEELKYRYLRYLDLKQWDELAGVFTEDATASYAGGNLVFAGRHNILEFLRDALATQLTSHKCHHPEIELQTGGRATGVWALEDVVIDPDAGYTIRGAAYYSDRYRKEGGAWRIEHTGYRRVYEELEMRKPPEQGGATVTADWWRTDGRSSLGPPPSRGSA